MQAERLDLPRDAYLCYELAGLAMRIDSAIAGSAGASGGVRVVLGKRGQSKVCSSVVQRVAVNVVYDHAIRRVQ